MKWKFMYENADLYRWKEYKNQCSRLSFSLKKKKNIVELVSKQSPFIDSSRVERKRNDKM